jgi:hypothetical protein
MGLMKVFSGNEILALALKGKLEDAGIDVVIRNNNQADVLPSIESPTLELFIQETVYAKALPVLDDFRMSI